MRSVLQNNKECWVCGVTEGLHDHHIFFGGNRKNSERYGLKVWLCGYHHNLSNDGVHFNRELDLGLKKVAQAKFEEAHSRDEFMAIFGRNYL